MAFRLYVGNYPQEFTRKDVQDLFREFYGVQVDRIFHLRDTSKCFAFITCEDIDQVLSVIKIKNGAKVNGRNLIVRASDDSLQEYVNLILQTSKTPSSKVPSVPKQEMINKTAETSSEIPFVPMQVMRNKRPHQYKKDNSEKLDSIPNMQSECLYPNSQNKVPISKNDSLCSPSSKYNNYQQKQDLNFCESFDSNLQISSKYENKVNNQTNFKNYVGTSSNSHETKNYRDKYQYETNTNHSSKSLVENNSPQPTKSNNGLPKNISPNSQKFYRPKNDTDKQEYFETNSNSSKSFHGGYSRKPSNDVFENSSNSPNYNQHHKNEKSVQIKRNRSNFSESSQNSQEMSEKNSNSFSSSSSYSDRNGHSDTSKDKTSHRHRNRNTPTWVSVTNFRFRTCAGYLFDLFADYHPIEVRMISNEPRYDDTLTEAHVCFPSRDIADDVIMNFDNTVLMGRVILVNDVEDLTIMNELLNVSRS